MELQSVHTGNGGSADSGTAVSCLSRHLKSLSLAYNTEWTLSYKVAKLWLVACRFQDICLLSCAATPTPSLPPNSVTLSLSLKLTHSISLSPSLSFAFSLVLPFHLPVSILQNQKIPVLHSIHDDPVASSIYFRQCFTMLESYPISLYIEPWTIYVVSEYIFKMY